MSEHLPECPKSGCAACYEQGQRDALDAAVQRVTRLYTSGDNYPDWPSSFMYVDTVIEAIKGDQP